MKQLRRAWDWYGEFIQVLEDYHYDWMIVGTVVVGVGIGATVAHALGWWP